MGASKTFTARFDLIGNLESKLEALRTRITSITDSVNVVSFEADDGALKDLNDLNGKLQSSLHFW